MSSTADALRKVLTISPKFLTLVEDLDIITLSTFPPIDLDVLSEGEFRGIAEWLYTDGAEVPKVIAEYVQKVKESSPS